MADTETLTVDPEINFVPGNRAMLVLMGQRYLVTVQSVDDGRINLTFPAQDFPIDGMQIEIEFHNADGFVRYETEVLEGPRGPGDGVTVKRPDAVQQLRHRTRWRVKADFEAKVKDHVHPRVHQVPVLNVSAGGMLIRTVAALKLGDGVDLAFEVPGGGAVKVVGEVVHVEKLDGSGGHSRVVGIRFVSLDVGDQQMLTHYVWRRIRESRANSIAPGPGPGETA